MIFGLNVSLVWLVAGLALLPGNSLATISKFAASVTKPTAQTQVQTLSDQAMPVARNGLKPPALTATAVYAVDVETGTVLLSKNADQPRPIASITKLATVITYLSRHNLNDTITVPPLPAYQAGAELIGLKPGERYKTQDIVAAALIPSANDAADTLALSDAGSLEEFSKSMQEQLANWGIEGAQFSNPTGLTTGTSLNQVSAAGVANMGQLLVRNPQLRQLVQTQTQTISSLEGRPLSLATTNQLLKNSQFNGIKTGYTPEAGQCFVSLATVNGHQIVTVVLGSQDRFGETEQLVNWIKRSYEWL
ncbi:D-alanyl-D-alanine carboxypeptidase [Patescibacteria group bacterium]|nr:MAG: D-alanyl-D-alanine carboxypeptidase [Patescibacteria group bacterium]